MPSLTAVLVGVVLAGLFFAIGWLTGWLQHRQQRREYRTTHELLFAVLREWSDITRELTRRGAIVPRFDPAGRLANVTLLETPATFVDEKPKPQGRPIEPAPASDMTRRETRVVAQS